MAKVECFDIPGLKCWFYSNDHSPPHFHAKQDGQWEIRVKFAEGESQMFEQKWGKRPGKNFLRQIARCVKDHRAQLLAEWEVKVNQ